jgi:predicted nucleic acid-binding protein
MTTSTLGNEFVTDTMAFVLRIERRRLGPKAKSAFDSAEAGSALIHVPGIVLAEILYLSEKKRIQADLSSVSNYLTQFANIREYPLSLAVAQSAAQIHDIPELHDRLIAGTARLLQRELLSNDPAIQASTSVGTIW